MPCVSDFLNTLFKNILERPISPNVYVTKYNISRNNFVYYIKTNKPMSNPVADALYKIIIDTIREEPEKEASIKNYMNQFITDEKNLTTEGIIKLGISKFTATNKTIKRKNKIRAVSFQDIQEMKIDVKDLIIEAMLLDSEIFDDIPVEHEGTLDQWFDLGNEYPDTWRYLFDENNKIIGYWSFKPLFDNDFIKAKEGLLFDNELNLNMMPMLVQGTYNIYFVEICLDNKHKGTATLRLLLNSIASAIEILASKEIFIDEICTQAYTADGERLCKSLGLKYHKKHVDCGDIYCGSIKDLLDKPFCRDFHNLKKLYYLNSLR